MTAQPHDDAGDTDFLGLTEAFINSVRARPQYGTANAVLSLQWMMTSVMLRNADRLGYQWAVISQQLVSYHRSAFVEYFRDEANSSLALLRMSSELARDFFRIAENERLMEIWSNLRKRHDKKNRDKFRWNTENPYEHSLKLIYKIASNYGVHGHWKFEIDTGDVEIIDGTEYRVLK